MDRNELKKKVDESFDKIFAKLRAKMHKSYALNLGEGTLSASLKYMFRDFPKSRPAYKFFMDSFLSKQMVAFYEKQIEDFMKRYTKEIQKDAYAKNLLGVLEGMKGIHAREAELSEEMMLNRILYAYATTKEEKKGLNDALKKLGALMKGVKKEEDLETQEKELELLKKLKVSDG